MTERSEHVERLEIVNGFRQIDRSGFGPALLQVQEDGVLPQGATALFLAVASWLARKEQGQGALAQRLEKMQNERNWPALNYAFADEHALAQALCAVIEADGALTEQERALLLERRLVPAALALYVYFEAEKYCKIADIATAMTLEAVRGELGAFDARLHELARPFPGQIASAENVRRLVTGSEMTTEEGRMAYGYDKHPRVQDAISLRAAPQTHGGVRDVHTWLGDCLEDELRHGLTRTGYALEYAVDWLIIALADLGNISEERTFRLTEEKFSYGLPTNLVFHQGYNHGYPVVQACQAAMLADLKLEALPSAAVKTEPRGMAYESCVRALNALPLISKVLATEVLLAAQAMDIVKDKLPQRCFGKGTQAAWGAVRTRVDVLVENRFVAPDMCAADELVMDGTLLAAAEAAVGTLC